MKRVLVVVGVLVCMTGSYFALKELFIYYATRPLSAASTIHTVEVKENKNSLKVIRTTHEGLNSFLNFGRADIYTEGDWKQLKQWFQEQEPSLQALPQQITDKKLQRDVTRAYETLKLGMEKTNIQLVVYGHRIYHDLDILVNQYSEETNVWHYTEFEKSENVQAVEAAIQAIP